VQIKPGAVAFWSDLFPGHSKFVFILGTYICPNEAVPKVAYFTISSQSKWKNVPRLKDQMILIPKGKTDFLQLDSYIQCFHHVGTIRLQDFREQELQGYINYRGDLSCYVPQVRCIVEQSEVLVERDRIIALEAIDQG
jgi:hypothetical protein